MRKRYFRITALLGILFLLVPAANARSFRKELKISLREKRVQDMSPEGLTLNFILEVANASAEPCLLTRTDYRVMVDNAEFFRLNKTLDAPLDIAPSGKTLVSLPVKFTYAYVQQVLPGVFDRETFGCTLVGGLVFAAENGRRGERLNVALTGDVPVFKGFGTAVGPLEVRALSVGGADLVFRAEFRNRSAFPAKIESIRYRLNLGSVRVAEGVMEGSRLDPSGSSVLSVPLLLDFFELEADLHSLLLKTEADFRLSGELRILTAWGSHAVPFDEEDRVSVRRAE